MDDDSPVTYETSINSNVDLIEEDKMVLPGIKIRAAKIPTLIQILIDSFDTSGKIIPDTDFPRVFFLMHKWFMESDTLASMLVEIYNKYEKDLCNTEKASNQQKLSTNNQLKLCHAMQYWIGVFPFHFVLDSRLTDVIQQFASSIQVKGHEDHLQFVNMSNISDNYEWMRKFTTKNPSRFKETIPLAFNKIAPDVLANQLTYLEWKTLRRISFSDYKSYAIKGSIQDIPPLERSIQLFNGLSQWIQCMVLSKTTPKQRADVIHKFIEVAQHLRQLQNFNTLMAVIGGICHSALARLSKTNLYLSSEDQKILNDYMELLSSSYNYAQYRKAISEVNSFWIPIIGIHLKDMISIHTAHLDMLENDLVNFRKMALLSIIFQNLTDLQNSAPPVQENRDLIKLLQLSLDMSYSEDEIYELSLAREPRTSVSSPSTPTKFTAFADWAKGVSIPPDPQTIQRHVNAMVDAVFKNYDHDRDGFISHAEFEEIAQNFPFIDSFAVLDADQDGMISKVEMKSYFLKANYHALKSEFKHDFHEITYFKPTFCTQCDGLLWGLIKQGWKCKDCGINAHRHCKDRVVMECRSKRTIGITRQFSSSGTESVRKRSSVQKRSIVKQKSTQTETYDDLFLSDDSITSNEDNCTRENTIINANMNTDDGNLDSPKNLNVNKYNDSFDHSSVSPLTNIQESRHTRYKKISRRRKSLPSQSSSNDEPHPVTLIPRGPLICSNNENMANWIQSDRSILKHHNNNSPTPSSCNSTSTFDNTSISTNDKIPLILNKTEESRLHHSTSLTVNTLSPMKSLTNTKNYRNIRISSFNNQIPSTVNYDVNIIKTTIYNTSNSLSNSNNISSISFSSNNSNNTTTTNINTTNNNNNNKEQHSLQQNNNSAKFRTRIESDFSLNDFIDDYQLDDEVIEATYSSNDDDADIVHKLKEAEKEREKLANENAKIKQQLESANAQISSLKHEMSSMRKDTINFILDQMDTLQFQNKSSEA